MLTVSSSTRRIGVVGLLALAVVGNDVATGADRQAANVVPVSPERVLDTRLGIGQPAAGAVGPGGTITLTLAGVGSIPADALAVELNVTATRATAASYVSAWPSGETQPTTSILNFGPGQDIANMVTVKLGDGGAINLFNHSGNVDLVADVAGYLLSAGPGTPGPQGPAGPVGPQGPGAETTYLPFSFDPDAPNSVEVGGLTITRTCLGGDGSARLAFSYEGAPAEIDVWFEATDAEEEVHRRGTRGGNTIVVLNQTWLEGVVTAPGVSFLIEGRLDFCNLSIHVIPETVLPPPA